jgi:hypothetical protein
MKICVCGTRGKFKDYQDRVNMILDYYKTNISEIIEGCCPNSADRYAERWAEKNNIPVHHYPANSGNYLKRNIEMVEACDKVIAFWDGYSYGTAHTIATAARYGKPIQMEYPTTTMYMEAK